MKSDTVIISACLLGIPCRYDGKIAKNILKPSVMENIPFNVVPVCPEQLSGLPTPRIPVEIQEGTGQDVLNGKAFVKTRDGLDYTDHFIKGACLTLEIAKITGASKMIGQKRSPSCSCCGVYNGSFNRTLLKGFGVCTAFLKSNGIEVVDIDEFHHESQQ